MHMTQNTKCTCKKRTTVNSKVIFRTNIRIRDFGKTLENSEPNTTNKHINEQFGSKF
jgi:hypothetical protein